MRHPIRLAAMAALFLLGGGFGAAASFALANAASAAPQANAAGTQGRASEIADCVSGAPGHLPESADATAFCTCAVDKMLTNNLPQRDAINQCADQMRINVVIDIDSPESGSAVPAANDRTRQIGECAGNAQGHLPASADANAFCTCAVDRMLTTNVSQREAVNQCAAEMHIDLRNQS